LPVGIDLPAVVDQIRGGDREVAAGDDVGAEVADAVGIEQHVAAGLEEGSGELPPVVGYTVAAVVDAAAGISFIGVMVRPVVLPEQWGVGQRRSGQDQAAGCDELAGVGE